MKKSKKPTLTPKEVEKIYQIPQTTQSYLRRVGRITYQKSGGRITYRPEWVEEYTKPRVHKARA